jgi:hypothetical protein
MQVVASDTFETIIMVLVMLNIACLAVYHVGMSEALTVLLFWISMTFTVIFTIEVIVKLIGLGIKQYFRDPWCIFVTLLSLVQIPLDVAAKQSVPAFNLLRVFRVARVFRLVPKVCSLYLWLPAVTSL